ncbi:hypothetical protein Ab1vBOLIVR4_gp15 [Agrobacterium phage OLIVR4]|nr:hypothetical protein Ab1vBOLIVR4_gp15 [Agrobacterium phage OLIVR4]
MHPSRHPHKPPTVSDTEPRLREFRSAWKPFHLKISRKGEPLVHVEKA